MFRRLLDLIKLLFALFSFVTMFYIILEFAYFISYSKPIVRGKDGKVLTVILHDSLKINLMQIPG